MINDKDKKFKEILDKNKNSNFKKNINQQIDREFTKIKKN